MNSTVESVERWLNEIVIGLNLCPFAKREVVQGKVRFRESQAMNAEDLLKDLVVELALLNKKPEIETSLLIHPAVLNDFSDYNQFLDFADSLLLEMHLEGVYQIASFHPDYQFADTAPDDPENFTNRSPFPLLHILRENSLESAIARHPDAGQIPDANIKLMREKGAEYMRHLLESCLHD